MTIFIKFQTCESVRPEQGSKTPKSGQKRVSESKNSHFPSPQKRASRVKKSPFLYRPPQGKWGCFDSRRPFLGRWEMGVFRLRNPLFPDFGVFDPCRGQRICNSKRSRSSIEERGTAELVFQGWNLFHHPTHNKSLPPASTSGLTLFRGSTIVIDLMVSSDTGVVVAYGRLLSQCLNKTF